MRVLVTDNTHPVLKEILERNGHEVTVDPAVDYDTLLNEVGRYDALVVRSKIEIDRTFLDHARHLKCIGRVGAGMETIDVAYAEALGIACLNSPEGNQDAVGEHALGLLLSLLDHIATGDREVRQGAWRREANRGTEIKGKTVGIVGFGHMGSAFAQRLRGFECEVVAYDKYKPTGYAPAYVREVSMEELWERAEIVSLHVPLTPETHHMVDKKFCERFAHDIFLVNTSRGSVVKTADLAEALRSGRVRGAALDVLEYEQMAQDGLDRQHSDLQYLMEQSNVVFSPHVAGWTAESKYKLARVLAEKMVRRLC